MGRDEADCQGTCVLGGARNFTHWADIARAIDQPPAEIRDTTAHGAGGCIKGRIVAFRRAAEHTSGMMQGHRGKSRKTCCFGPDIGV